MITLHCPKHGPYKVCWTEEYPYDQCPQCTFENEQTLTQPIPAPASPAPEDDAAWESASDALAEDIGWEPQPSPASAVGERELPDEPGPWFHGSIPWSIVCCHNGQSMAGGYRWDGVGQHEWHGIRTSGFPRGNWVKAVPASELSQLQRELAEAREEAQKWEAAAVARNDQAFEASMRATAAEQRAETAERERDEARLRLLSAAGDDLCRLSQEEIKELSSGALKVPPEEEFLASCKRFHQQIASGPGVLSDCLTLAQLIAENERLRSLLDSKGGQP